MGAADRQLPPLAAVSSTAFFGGQHGPAPLSDPCIPGAGSRPWQHRSSTGTAAPALMYGTEEIIFLFNDCMTAGGGLGEGCHCTGPCLAGKRRLLGCSFLEKLKPKHYPV